MDWEPFVQYIKGKAKNYQIKLGKVYAVGVGPGSPKYVTEIVKEIVQNCDIFNWLQIHSKNNREFNPMIKKSMKITMNDQEKSYQKILPELGDRTLVIPFTGDVNFSESESS